MPTLGLLETCRHLRLFWVHDSVTLPFATSPFFYSCLLDKHGFFFFISVPRTTNQPTILPSSLPLYSLSITPAAPLLLFCDSSCLFVKFGRVVLLLHVLCKCQRRVIFFNLADTLLLFFFFCLLIYTI